MLNIVPENLWGGVVMGCCKCEAFGWDDPQEVVWTDPGDGKEYCLFHAPAEQKGMSAKEFNDRVDSRIREVVDLGRNAKICNFSGAVFVEGVRFNINGALPNMKFDRAIFAGYVYLDGLEFGGYSWFDGAVFESDAVFFNSNFRKRATFYGARFENEADFSGVWFDETAQFSNAKFYSSSKFIRTNFCGAVGFECCKFEDVLRFERSKFHDQFLFNGAEVQDEVCFDAVEFESDISFDATIFHKNSMFKNVKCSKDALLRFKDCSTSKSGLLIQDCNLENWDLTCQRNLNDFQFIGSKWSNDGSIKLTNEDDPGALQLSRDFYQRMKRKYKDEHNENEASKWHIAEKEATLKLLKQNGESRFLGAMLRLYKLVSGFGENPFRAACVLGLFLLLPLVGVGIWDAMHTTAWQFNLAWMNEVLKDWLHFIPLTSASKSDGGPGLLLLLCFLSQVLITLQAALFAFALRNRFRR